MRIYGLWATQLCLNGLREETEALEAGWRGTAPRPELVLIETFDFVEICCGPRSPLCEAMALDGVARRSSRVDLAVRPIWDITSLHIFEWLLFLAEHKRVWW